jgi:hypothetical protein
MEQLQELGLSPMNDFGATLLRFILAGFWSAHWWFKVGNRSFLFRCGYIAGMDSIFRTEESSCRLSGLVHKSPRLSSALALFGSRFQRGCHTSQPCLVSGSDDQMSEVTSWHGDASYVRGVLPVSYQRRNRRASHQP